MMADVKMCEVCKLPLANHVPGLLGGGCPSAMDKAMTALLKQIGQIGTCSGCNGVVIWVTHRNGTHVPYTTEGLNHFLNCPEAEQFKKGKP